ncbi:MAG: hypothetical protein KC589_07775 [Nanoarchaeota archaeon]|nr:hypothetical protein [Nanoarchaeota archaeon]
MVLRNNYQKKGAQGIGTLIIFIALILVAAVAAGVLIQTASSLQSKSLDVGRQSQEKITTDIEVMQVYANGTADGEITGGADMVSVIARLGSGSSPIKLSDMLVKFDTAAASQSLTYTLGSTPSSSNYAETYILNGSNHQVGYMVEGDLIRFDFFIINTLNISESTGMAIRLIPKNGAVKPIEMSTPPAMVEGTTYFYP